MAEKYFLYPFGVNGNLLTIPNPTQISGTVSYQSGFPIGYEEANTSPGYLPIPRNQFNQLMFDVTSALQQIQQTGFPSFITAAQNGGSAYSYNLGAEVWSAGVPYRSLIANNTDTPPTSNWAVIGQNRSLYFNYAIDTGTANHYAIAPNPAMLSYADGNVIELRPAFGNTGACDINVNGIGIANIKTLQNQDPLPNMIIPAGVYTLVFNSNTSCFVLQNPSLGTAAYQNVGTSAGNVVQLDGSGDLPAVDAHALLNLPAQYTESAGASGRIVFGAITMQWGVTSVSSPATVAFGTAFSGQPYFVGWTGISPTGGGTNFTTGTQPYTHNITSAGFTVLGGTSGQAPYNWLAIGPT